MPAVDAGHVCSDSAHGVAAFASAGGWSGTPQSHEALAAVVEAAGQAWESAVLFLRASVAWKDLSDLRHQRPSASELLYSDPALPIAWSRSGTAMGPAGPYLAADAATSEPASGFDLLELDPAHRCTAGVDEVDCGSAAASFQC